MKEVYLIPIILIFLASYFLIYKNFKPSLYVLIVLSSLHKEIFSFYRWDLMPIRIFMVVFLCSGITKIYLTQVKNGGIKSLFPFLKDPFYRNTILLVWLTRGISIIFFKNSGKFTAFYEVVALEFIFILHSGKSR